MRNLLFASAAVFALAACAARELPDLTAEYDALVPSTAIVEGADGHGSGVFVAPGVVLTARHVATLIASGSATIRLADGSKAPAHALDSFERLDAALVTTSAPGRVAPLNCAPLHAGQPVTVIGSPLNMEFVVSHGWVSTTHQLTKSDAQREFYVMLDLNIAAGNSGGPVFDAHGAVVGFVDAMPAQRGDSGLGPISSPANGFAAIIPASAFCADVRASLARIGL